MAVVSEALPDVDWKKDWVNHTIYIADQQGGVAEYLVWAALDHLHGRATLYYNKDRFDKKAFKDAVERHELAMTANKGWGKGKGKALNSVRNLTPAEVADASGSFLEQVGLGQVTGKETGTASQWPWTEQQSRLCLFVCQRTDFRRVKSLKSTKSNGTACSRVGVDSSQLLGLSVVASAA